jgi:hypothetical protein
MPRSGTPDWSLSTAGPERFYLRMLDIEAGGAMKLDNYQNFARLSGMATTTP